MPHRSDYRKSDKLKYPFSFELFRFPYKLSNLSVETVTVHTEAQKVALITYNLATTRDFGPVLDALRVAEHRTSLYFYYLLLISDIDFIKFNNIFYETKDILLNRVLKSRAKRKRIETEQKGRIFDQHTFNQVKDQIENELYLLFGLSLLAHYDKPDKYDSHLFEKLFLWFLTPKEASRFPVNFILYFLDERLMFMFSLMLIGAFHNLRGKQVKRNLKSNMVKRIMALKDHVDTLSEEKIIPQILELNANYLSYVDDNDADATTNQVKVAINTIKENLDLILTELGEHDLQEHHEVIRFLHRNIIRQKMGHNAIFTNLNQLIFALDSKKRGLSRQPKKNISLEDQPDQRPSRAIHKLNEALRASTMLQSIAQAVKRLYIFTPVSHSENRFINGSTPSAFEYDIKTLESLLIDIRRNKYFTISQYDTIKKIKSRLRDDFYSSKSILRQSLKEYIIPTLDVLRDALVEADQRLKKRWFQ